MPPSPTPAGPSPSQRGRVTTLATGGLLLLAAVLLNPWSIAHLVAADDRIDDALKFGVIVAAQIALATSGLWLAARGPALRTSLAWWLATFGLIGVSAAGVRGNLDLVRSVKADQRLARVDRGEAVVLSLTASHLGKLGNSVMNLRFPDAHSYALFEDEVEVNSLVPSEGGSVQTVDEIAARFRQWQVEQDASLTTAREMKPWLPLMEQVRFFRDASFFIVNGRFTDDDETEYSAEVGFQGLARLATGGYSHVDAHLRVRWVKSAAGDEGEDAQWRIREWRTKDLTTVERETLLFADVLDRVVPSLDAFERARTSIHEELIVRSALEQDFEPPHDYFSLIAFDRHPGVSVVDIDDDGFDDVYVMGRWGKNMLFRNRGDGTFEEIASRLGLDIEDHTSGAIFADFDNDGDPDVVLGRTLARSMYLVNENGRFIDRSDRVAVPLPFLVGSLSVTDYDNDGLLDIYFSTYAAEMLARKVRGPAGERRELRRDGALPEFLTVEQSKELLRLVDEQGTNRVASWPGPPNLLLRNLGDGRFARAPNSGPLEVWSNTWQSTWADYDGDGDQDVLVANDFAPNNFVRNDGDAGFTDITRETGTADLGFGMGASWGDFDNDGRQDLYVTNMYSKAGRRVMSQVADLASKFEPMARGNSLFHNTASGFERISGLEPPAMTVEKAGWGWGGQFFDVDNDGYLDIYAPSGFYTAPSALALPEDT